MNTILFQSASSSIRNLSNELDEYYGDEHPTLAGELMDAAWYLFSICDEGNLEVDDKELEEIFKEDELMGLKAMGFISDKMNRKFHVNFSLRGDDRDILHDQILYVIKHVFGFIHDYPFIKETPNNVKWSDFEA